MKSLGYLVIESEQDYNNTVELAGREVVVNTTIESVENINRIGKVVSSPKGTILKPGDTVVVHHNIMRRKNNTAGKEIKSPFHIKDNKYYVPLTEVFAYKRDKDWIALDPYCFVEPIEAEEITTESIYVGKVDAYKGRENGVGYLRIANRELLEEEGLQIGDKVHFEPYSEHEFELDGKLYYKMMTKDIMAKEIE